MSDPVPVVGQIEDLGENLDANSPQRHILGRPEQSQWRTVHEESSRTSWSSGAEDIWALSLEGDRQPFPVLQTQAVDTNPALSPDGRWLAFESSHSGRPKVYVMRFPRSRNAIAATVSRWQVSTQGGSRPRWNGDGRALFYVTLDDHSIMRTEVRGSDAGFESDAPRMFAEIPVMSVARSPFDVSADGRLLVLERTINQGAPLAVIANWRALMARP